MISEFCNTPKQFVLIVGQQPSFANADQYVAFVGTRSHTTLMNWMEVLGIQNGSIINASDELGRVGLKDINYARFEAVYKSRPIDKVIALGEYASKALTKMEIEHYKLPHPSGRNRKLNSPEFIKQKIQECRLYLYPLQETLTPTSESVIIPSDETDKLESN